MRIATWNLDRPLKYGKVLRAGRQLSKIKDVNADIWILTETYSGFMVPGCRHVSSPSSGGIYHPSESAVAIWVREPCELKLVSETSVSVCAEARIPGVARPLLIYGSVLPWHSAPGGKTWQRNVEEARRQANEWRALRGSGEFADHWFCIAGDFNMTLHPGRGYGNDDARAAVREGLESVGLTCHTAIDIRSPQFGGFSRDNIDHICLDNRLSLKAPVEVWSGESPQGKLSDHNGVVIEIELQQVGPFSSKLPAHLE